MHLLIIVLFCLAFAWNKAPVLLQKTSHWAWSMAALIWQYWWTMLMVEPVAMVKMMICWVPMCHPILMHLACSLVV